MARAQTLRRASCLVTGLLSRLRLWRSKSARSAPRHSRRTRLPGSCREATEPRGLAHTADYEAHVRLRLVPAFGKLRLRDLTRHRIDAYIAAQHAGGKVSVKTINNSLIPLRQILARCVRDGYIANNPRGQRRPGTTSAAPVPGYETPQMRHFDRDQAAAYIAASRTRRVIARLAEPLIGPAVTHRGGCGARMGRRRPRRAHDPRQPLPARCKGKIGGTKGERRDSNPRPPGPQPGALTD